MSDAPTDPRRAQLGSKVLVVVLVGIFLFATPVTNFLVAGVAVTLLATAGYTYCKTTKVLESGKAKEII